MALSVGILALAAGGCGDRDQPTDKRPVVVSVEADPHGVVPGGRTTLLWRFRLADHWHLYWTGRNDSGFPPEIDLELPPGWIAGGLHWPAPERLVSAGDILDHVYHDELVLMQQLAAPEDAIPGAVLEATAEIRWLACKDSCVPGKAQVALNVPVVRTAAPAAGLLDAARLKVPLPLPESLLSLGWDGATFLVQPAGEAVDAPRRLVFMPTEDCGDLVDLLGDGDGERLALRFKVREGTAGPVRGLLAVTDRDGAVNTYVLSHSATQLTHNEPGGS